MDGVPQIFTWVDATSYMLGKGWINLNQHWLLGRNETLDQRHWRDVGPVFQISTGPMSAANRLPTDYMALAQRWSSSCLLAGYLEEWSKTWLLRFNCSKCKVMHVCHSIQTQYHMINNGKAYIVTETDEERD